METNHRQMSSPSFLDPDLLRRVQTLELRAREVAEGVLIGLHHAPHRGRSIEFAEHKEYSPGDDIRRIDWKLFAKSDRYYVKEFEDDTNIHAHLLLDVSSSMNYRSQTAKTDQGEPVLSKLDHARLLAAALSYLLLTQSDAVGLGFFSRELSEYLPPRARHAHFHEIVDRLATVPSAAGTDLAAALAGLLGHLKGRAMVIVFSDLLDDPAPMLKALRQLRHRRQELIVFQILDPDEIIFPFDRLSHFRDLESPLRLLVDPAGIQAEYRRYFAEFLAEVKKECTGHGIDYRLARTDESPVRTLTSWLSFRAALSAGRHRVLR